MVLYSGKVDNSGLVSHTALMSSLKDLDKLRDRTDALLQMAERGQQEAKLHQERYTQALHLLNDVVETVEGNRCSACDSSSCDCSKYTDTLLTQIKEFLHAET